MNYFAINFPNMRTFLVKSKEVSKIEDIVVLLNLSDGLRGFGNAIYNPKQFISVESIGSPDEFKESLYRKLNEVLF